MNPLYVSVDRPLLDVSHPCNRRAPQQIYLSVGLPAWVLCRESPALGGLWCLSAFRARLVFSQTLGGLWCLLRSPRVLGDPVAVSVTAPLLSWLRSVPLCRQATFCLSAHALMDIWAVSTSFGSCE